MIYGYCRVSTLTQAKDGNNLEVQDLLDAGKPAAEIQKALGISRSTFFKYKKFSKKKATET